MRPFSLRSSSAPARRNTLPPPDLVLRRDRPRVVRTVVERRAAPQTVVHNHITQVVRQTVCHRRDTVFRLLPPPGREAEEAGEDRSRPTLAAQRLVRLFSAESARRELRPFFQTVVRNVLEEERERARSRPEQEISLVYHLFGERYLLRTLDRLRRETWEREELPAAAPSPRPPEREEDAPCLSGAEFRALVRGVERSLDRRGRLELLRQGRA